MVTPQRNNISPFPCKNQLSFLSMTNTIIIVIKAAIHIL